MFVRLPTLGLLAGLLSGPFASAASRTAKVRLICVSIRMGLAEDPDFPGYHFRALSGFDPGAPTLPVPVGPETYRGVQLS
jgi:hypothetical protein